MRPPPGDRKSADVPRETVAFTPPAPPPLAPAHRAAGPNTVPEEIEFDPRVGEEVPPTRATQPEDISEVSFAETQEPESGRPSDVGVKHVRVGSNVDILAELERLRKNATSLSPSGRPARRTTSGVSVDDLLANSLNHRKEVSRIFDVDVPRRELASGHHVAVTLKLTGRNNELLGDEKTFSIPLEAAQDLEKLVLALKFQIFGK